MIAALRQIAAELRLPDVRPYAAADLLDRIADGVESDRAALDREVEKRRALDRALHEQQREEARHDFRRFR